MLTEEEPGIIEGVGIPGITALVGIEPMRSLRSSITPAIVIVPFPSADGVNVTVCPVTAVPSRIIERSSDVE